MIYPGKLRVCELEHITILKRSVNQRMKTNDMVIFQRFFGYVYQIHPVAKRRTWSPGSAVAATACQALSR